MPFSYNIELIYVLINILIIFTQKLSSKPKSGSPQPNPFDGCVQYVTGRAGAD
jgi:hypothetical protein